MKRFLGLVAGLLTIGTLAFADPHGTGSGLLWQSTGQTQSTSYVNDLNNSGEIVSAQINYSTAIIASVTVDAPAFALNGTLVTGSNKFTTALPVLYTSTVTIGGLSNNTTYYVNGTNPTGTSPSFYVSSTSTGAVAGSYITFTSTPSGSGFSIKFAPLAVTGSGGFQWGVSDDNVNYTNLTTGDYGAAISSVTFSTPYTTASALYSLGSIKHRYLKLSVTPFTTGGLSYTVWFNQATLYVGN